MARPNPPGVSRTPSGRGFLFLLQILREARHLSRRKREVGASPGGARRAGSEGERGRSKAHKPGLKSGSGGAAGLHPWKAAAGGRAHRLADSGGGIPLGGRAAVLRLQHGGRRRSRAQGLLPRHPGSRKVPPGRAPRQRPRAASEILRNLYAEVLGRLAEGVAGRRGFVARRALFDNKPCEPEMWLYLAAKTFPPCRYSGTMEEFRAPWLGMKEEARPKIVQLYQESAWRREDMSLLEFARKTNKKGEIAQWVLHKRNKQGSAEPLEDFANNCKTEGEKLIAVEMVSVF